jgi:hypothetical protein
MLEKSQRNDFSTTTKHEIGLNVHINNNHSKIESIANTWLGLNNENPICVYNMEATEPLSMNKPGAWRNAKPNKSKRQKKVLKKRSSNQRQNQENADNT